MAEMNPTTVIADCIEKSKATADQELIADYITEALGILRSTTPKRMRFICSAAQSSTPSQVTKRTRLVYSKSGRSLKSSGSWRNAQVRYCAIALKRLLRPAPPAGGKTSLRGFRGEPTVRKASRCRFKILMRGERWVVALVGVQYSGNRA
jgi:hypothetical protein